MLIGYARISTPMQNLDAQINALTAAGVDDRNIFQDVASGADTERDGLADAMSHLRTGDVLVVQRLDRLGRSLKDLLERISELEDRDVEFRSLTEGIRTDTAAGKLVFQLFGAMAEFERNLIRERTMAGLEAARRNGRTGGRPKKVAFEDMPILSRLMRADDVSSKQICERFDITRKTLYKYVGPEGEWRNEEYRQKRDAMDNESSLL